MKQNISLAPNNLSAWNYLRGIMEHTKTPFFTVKTFVRPYTLPIDPTSVDIVDLENPPPTKGANLPCPAAIEFLADVYEQEKNTLEAIEVRRRFLLRYRLFLLILSMIIVVDFAR